jgi:Secretion system C-terminal sorting domain
MKKLYIILALAIFASVAVQAQVSITFRVTLKGTGKKLHPDSLRTTGALGLPAVTGQNEWDPPTAKKMKLVGSVADSIYAVTLTVTRPANNIIAYKHVNGGAWGDGAGGVSEDERALGTAGACADVASGNRNYTIPATGTSFILPAYRFNSCVVVFQTGVNELSTAANMDIYPNPATSRTTLTFDSKDNAAHSLELVNVTGQIVRTYAPQTGTQFDIERGSLPAGMYFARVKNTIGESRTVRFIME